MERLVTPRLQFRRITEDDTGFIYELYGTESFRRFIGDKHFQNLEDAREFIASSLVRMYEHTGHGLLLVERREDATPIGICGLIRRDSLEDVDLGFGYLPQYEGGGYGYESAMRMIDLARDELRLPRIVAITTADNHRCIRLLDKLGFRFERIQEVLPHGGTLGLYGLDFT
jgi:ribosomal-protein-alanine N-acetyltransferase